MRILALETSTPTLSVALLDGDEIVGERSADVGAGASARILPWADELLASAGWGPGDLDAVAASVGPGSFTGLRVGLATAKSLAWSADIALVGESSLRTLAASVRVATGERVAPVLDARRGQVYAALFEGARWTRVGEDVVVDPEPWATELIRRGPLVAVGDGLDRYPQQFKGLRRVAGVRPNARHLALLGHASLEAGVVLDPRSAAPNYVRPHGAVPPTDMRG